MTILIQAELRKEEKVVHTENVELDKYGHPPQTLVFQAEEYQLAHHFQDKAKYNVVTEDDDIPF